MPAFAPTMTSWGINSAVCSGFPRFGGLRRRRMRSSGFPARLGRDLTGLEADVGLTEADGLLVHRCVNPSTRSLRANGED